MAAFEQLVSEVCQVAQRFVPRLEDTLMVIEEKCMEKGYYAMGNNMLLFRLKGNLPTIADPDTADRVLQRVLDDCLPMSAWMVAVVYDRVNTLFRMDNNADETVDMDFLRLAVCYLARHKMWSSILAIFDRLVFPSEPLRILLGSYSLDNDPAGLEVFRTIMHYPWDYKELASLFRDVMKNALVKQFEVFVNSSRTVVRNVVVNNLKSFMAEFCIERMKCGSGSSSKRFARLGTCFMAAAKAGLFTAADPEAGTPDHKTHRECMVMAAVANQPDLVLCLHHCGTLGSRDYSAMLGQDKVKAIGTKDPAQVWGLHRRAKTVPFDDEAKKTALGIKSFLAKQASNSTPMPLKKMLLQRLLKQVGWGFGREKRIREMDILEALKDELRFKGLENFLKKSRKREGSKH